MMRRIKNRTNAIEWRKVWNLSNLSLIFGGVSLAIVGMKGFMIPNKLIDGGITGISILLNKIFNFPISVLTIVLNAPFVYLGYKWIGKTFAVQMTIAVILLSIGLRTIHVGEPPTHDHLLIAIFGGTLIGTGIGLVIRGGGVIDGAEVLAVFTRRKTGFSNSEIIMLFNTVIFLVAALKFDIQTTMYCIITYFTATRATNYVVDGIEEYTAMNIVSRKPDEIKDFLVNGLGKGITVYKGERGYLPGRFEIKEDTEIIVTIITRLEIKQIQDSLMKIDPAAFIYVQRIKEAAGGILKARAHAV